jgi:ribose/xylose/arabinose/galactoside ABC-type transport system permease subunit
VVRAARASGFVAMKAWGRRAVASDFLILWVALGYAGVLAPFTPGFLTAGNGVNLLLALLPLLLVALGETVVLITGGIDLALPSVLAVASVAGASVMSGGDGWVAVGVGVWVMLLAGGMIGLVNGVAVAGLRMPPFIVTLTTMMFFSGVAVWWTRAETVGGLPAAFNALGGQLAWALVFAGLLAVGVHGLLSRTLWGRWLYAVGHNERASRVSGVPVVGVVISAYVLSGLLGGAGAVLFTAQAESGSPVLGERLLLDVVGAAVIGGTSLFGGRGKVIWTLFGVLFIKLIDNTLNLLGLSYFTIMMVKGGVILLAALLDGVRRRIVTDA